MSTHCNIDGGSKPEILSTPTEALSSIPVIRVDELVPPALSTSSGCHSRGPSDPNVIPPSPTLSTRSPVHFGTPIALQDDKPEGGMASLALINPTDHSVSHSRRPSYATVTRTDDGTITDQSTASHIYPATSNTTNSVGSPVKNLDSPAPTHVDSTSEIDKFENQIRDHWKPVEKVESGVQAVAESDDKDIAKVRDDPLLFPRLCRGHVAPFSPIFKNKPPRIPKDDRVTL